MVFPPKRPDERHNAPPTAYLPRIGRCAACALALPSIACVRAGLAAARARTRSQPPTDATKPSMSSSAAAVVTSADAAGTYVPELRFDLMNKILELLAEEGEVASLCVALCISKPWQEVALQPRLWRHLCNFTLFDKRWAASSRLTDERLAQLVQRATGADSEHHLRRLDVTGCRLVTARGVALALRGLEGTLNLLLVAGVLSGEDDADDVMPPLQRGAYMRRGGPCYSDMHQHLLCNAPDAHGLGEPPICSRLCTLCEECGIISLRRAFRLRHAAV